MDLVEDKEYRTEVDRRDRLDEINDKHQDITHFIFSNLFSIPCLQSVFELPQCSLYSKMTEKRCSHPFSNMTNDCNNNNKKQQ